MSLDAQKLTDLLTALASFNAAIRGRLDGKLDINAVAFDSNKLGGKTLAEVQALIGDAAAADLAALNAEFEAFIARQDNPHNVTKAQVGLGNVDNFGTATNVEAVAGVLTDKFLTPANLQAFWADKVGTAPETLDTIQELAAALQNNPDALTALQQIAGDNQAAIAQLQTDLAAAIAGAAADATAKADAAQAAAIAAAATDATAKADAAEADANAYTDGREAAIRTDMASGLASKLGVLDTAANSAKLEGSTKAEIIAEAQAGVDMTNVVQKTDDFGQYSVGGQTLTALVAALQTADTSNADEVAALQTAFNAFVAAKATGAEVIAGTDDVKYTTSLAVKAAIQAAIDELAGAAPETLDTINEIAAALNNDPDVINNLTSLIGTKLTQAEVQAEIAAALVPVDARIDALEAAVGEGSNFLEAGESDLGLNPVALATDGENPAQNLKSHIERLDQADAALDSRITTEKAALQASIQGVQDSATANANAIASTNTAVSALDGRVVTLEGQIQDKLEAGDAIGTNTVTFPDQESLLPTQQALDDVLEQLRLAVEDVQSGAATDLAALQTAFNNFVAAKATTAEVIAGTDDAKYTTSLSVKGAIDAAIAELAGTAPEALNTINELAAALNNDPDIINTLMTQIGTKLDATAQAVDSAKLEGRTIADMTASNQDVIDGTSTDKFVTPAALSIKQNAQDAAIAANTASINDLMVQLAAAFDAAADDLDPAPAE